MRNRALVVLALVLLNMPSYAALRTIDLASAATLLIPYFETDPSNEFGVDTLITIQNTSASALVAHVVLWTDAGIPTANFDLYLTGYDYESISMRAVFNRAVPMTADAGADFGDTNNPDDGISNKGILSQDINFPGVETQFESCTPPGLLEAHTGLPSAEYFGGLCGAHAYGDGRARGYVTIDSVTQYNDSDPSKAGYFTGIADYRNILHGEVTFVDRPRNRIFTEPAVHIEAAVPGTGSQFVAGNTTFYGRFTNWSGSDQREPLPTAWAGVWAGPDVAVEYWRDPGVPVSPFVCGTDPFTLDERQIVAYLESGATAPISAGNPFPRASGVATSTALGLGSGFGWLFMNLNLPAPSGPQGVIRQSWVTMRNTPRELGSPLNFGYGSHGTQLGNASTGDNPTKP
jgi:hypothetical protein